MSEDGRSRDRLTFSDNSRGDSDDHGLEAETEDLARGTVDLRVAPSSCLCNVSLDLQYLIQIKLYFNNLLIYFLISNLVGRVREEV